MDTIFPLSPPLAHDVQLYAIGCTTVQGLGAGCELLGTTAQACGFQLRRAAKTKASGGDKGNIMSSNEVQKRTDSCGLRQGAGQTQLGSSWGLAWEGQTTRKWMAYWGREQGVGGGGNKLPHLVDGGDRGHKLDVSSFGNSPKPISVIIHWWTGQAWLPGPVQALRSGPPSPTPICLPRLPL